MAATPFTFTPTDFKDGASGGTPITAAELNKINTAVSQLYRQFPNYTVGGPSVAPPSTPCLMTVIDANNTYQGTWYNDGTASTQIQWPRKQPTIRSIGFTLLGTAKYTNVIAPDVSGYTFLCWLQPSTTAGSWASLHLDRPASSNTNVWHDTGGSDVTGTCYALYIPA